MISAEHKLHYSVRRYKRPNYYHITLYSIENGKDILFETMVHRSEVTKYLMDYGKDGYIADIIET